MFGPEAFLILSRCRWRRATDRDFHRQWRRLIPIAWISNQISLGALAERAKGADLRLIPLDRIIGSLDHPHPLLFLFLVICSPVANILHLYTTTGGTIAWMTLLEGWYQ